jgi:peroxiredoxin family protein
MGCSRRKPTDLPQSPAVTVEPPRVVLFLHSADYDRVHQGLAIGAAAAALGKQVELYFFWWALERLLDGRLDEPDFHPPRPDVADRFESKGLPSARELLQHLRASGQCLVVACTGSLAALGRNAQSAAPHVDQVLGWAGILQRTAGVVDRFYL